MSLAEELRSFILNQYLSGENADKLDLNDNLIDTGILDSMTLMKFISYLEKKHNIKITNDELTPDNFESIEVIARFIELKQK